MKVAIAQMTSKASPEHNFSVCEKMAKRAAKNGAEMVFWPESTDIIFDGDYPKEEERADYEGSRLKKFVDQMSGLAKEVRCVVFSPVFPLSLASSLADNQPAIVILRRPNSTSPSALTFPPRRNPRSGTCPT